MSETGIRIVAILGTKRGGNYTRHALAIVVDELERHGARVTLLDAATLELAFPGAGDSRDAAGLRAGVKAADGVVLATPEYHGSFSSALKLVIENLGFPSALKGKTVSLLGVAAGRIGAVKSLEHLRSVASHVGATVLPAVVSVARVRDVFVEGVCQDPSVEKQLRSLASRLLEYLRTHVCPNGALESAVRE